MGQMIHSVLRLVAIPEAIFFAIFSMCIFQVRFSSICTPRDLVDETCFMGFPSIKLLGDLSNELVYLTFAGTQLT